MLEKEKDSLLMYLMQDVYFKVFGKRGDWSGSVFEGSRTMTSIRY